MNPYFTARSSMILALVLPTAAVGQANGGQGTQDRPPVTMAEGAPAVQTNPAARPSKAKMHRRAGDGGAIQAADTETSAASIRVAEVVAGVQTFYGAANDLKANFKQTYTYTVYGRSQLSSGVVYFKKPGMMRWDYRAPTPKVFVADGKVLWIYEPEENQAFKREIGSSQLPVALTFMNGEGSLSDAFHASLKTDTSTSIVLNLVPKKDAGEYQRIELECDPKTFAVRSSLVIDPVGNTNRIDFLEIELNRMLPDRGFQFTPPKGVRIITDPRQPGRP
ncbi:MAG: outer membrane lipoprotein carrier protein LolA [Myxococcota bacterium]|nr:outer membrane lipoprotein carrier protein LolA [Myxococcota bacterium]